MTPVNLDRNIRHTPYYVKYETKKNSQDSSHVRLYSVLTQKYRKTHKNIKNPSAIGYFYHFLLTFSHNHLLYLLLMSPENEIIEIIETE